MPITFFGDDGIISERLSRWRASARYSRGGRTGGSWLSRHLAAAICGANLAIQGGSTTEGTSTREHRPRHRRGRDQSLIKLTMIAIRRCSLRRLTLVPDVQDALVSILSEKAVAVPELPDSNMVFARPGFNIIATANTRDQGVNELSAALKRRVNYVYIPIVADKQTEVKIVQQRSAELLERYNLPAKTSPPVIELLATVCREIRNGKTADGVRLKTPSTTLSTAEAIGVALDAALHARSSARRGRPGGHRPQHGRVGRERGPGRQDALRVATLVASG